MKKIAFVCLFFVCLRAGADLVVVEQIVEPRARPHTITFKIKGDKYRKDFPDNTSVICDFADGSVMQISHAAKTYLKISEKQAEMYLSEHGKKEESKPAAPPRIVDTGKSEKAGDYDAEIYQAVTPGATFTYWVAKDYPAAVSGEMKKFRERSAELAKSGETIPWEAQIDGVVIKSECLSVGGQRTTVVLLSASAVEVPDSEFQAPEGYKDAMVTHRTPEPAPASALPAEPASVPSAEPASAPSAEPASVPPAEPASAPPVLPPGQ